MTASTTTRRMWQPADGNWRAFGVRAIVLNIGLMLFAVALVLGYRSGLGLNAWNIFQIALTKYIPITPGQMSIAVGGIMILVAWRAGIPPAIATVCNMVFVGLWFDFFAARIPEADRLAVALPMLIGGVVLIGWASAIYIKAGLGAGPRDSFMLAVVRKTGWNVGVARLRDRGDGLRAWRRDGSLASRYRDARIHVRDRADAGMVVPGASHPAWRSHRARRARAGAHHGFDGGIVTRGHNPCAPVLSGTHG